MLTPDITRPEFKANPFPFYAYLRYRWPILQVILPNKRPAWLITRYSDVVAVLNDARFGKNARRVAQSYKRVPARGMFRPLTGNMLDLDPPDHSRLRGLVQRVFTPGVVERMAQHVESLAAERLQLLRSKMRVDLIQDYALPIPTTVIAELLGIPAGDRHRFHRWSAKIVASESSSLGSLRAIPSLTGFIRYIRRQIDLRRTEPTDDLLTALVQAEESGDRMSTDELVAMVFLLIVAGYETTVNAIGNGMLALLEDSDQQKLLRDNPALIEQAIEELLRFAGPLETATERFALQAIEIGGTFIDRGDLVYAVLASANRDETQFSAPDRLDITRHPNRHVAFGHGIHSCLGAPLARLEMQIAIRMLIQSTERIALSVPRTSLQWRQGLVLRGLKSLPVSVTLRSCAFTR